MLLDAQIRKKFRWAVRDLVRDDGNAMQSFDASIFERLVADIHDEVIAEMTWSEEIRQAIRSGVKNFNVAYVKGVLKKALKGKQVPNPGIIMSATSAVDGLAEEGMPPWLKKKVRGDEEKDEKKSKKRKKGKRSLPPAFLKQMGKK
jgi:hypothetical protein